MPSLTSRRTELDRREFMRRTAALGMTGAALTIGAPVGDPRAQAAGLARQAAAAAAARPIALDVAEWSYFWVNVRRAETARGAFVGGQQMYVEYMIPAQVRHPLPVVLVHGGGGQGTDWLGTPDGRPGWFQYLVEAGFQVYVVDRPGHGRSPRHPDLHGPFPPRALSLESIAGRFTPPGANPAARPNAYQLNHTQWPGTGHVGSDDLARLTAGMGGSYVARPGGPATGGPAAGPGADGPPVPANRQPAGPLDAQHLAWREAGAELLDRIGPAIVVTHSAGGPFGLLVAEARPELVRATIIIEGAGGGGFAGGNRWGLSTIPVTWDPPVDDPSEIETTWIADPEPGVPGYFLQAEPARSLPRLAGTRVLVATADASFASPGSPGTVAFLRQAGVDAEELRWGALGITGNGHAMMLERNSREVLQPVIDWMHTSVAGPGRGAPVQPARQRGDSLALRLADAGMFWVGTSNTKQTDYGTIHTAPMFVQYLIPAERRHPVPVVLVHGGGGQMVHFMGLGGLSGWAHHFVQAGYAVYLVDRPGHGRSVYHPHALGEMGPLVTYDLLTRDTVVSAGPGGQWPGESGDAGDPLIDQLMAAANSVPLDSRLAERLWRLYGAELLDRIGPAILLTHSAGGAFGWLVASERPDRVRAVVSFEGSPTPLVAPDGRPGTRLPNLKGIPVMYLLSERGGRDGRPVIDALTRSGARAELVDLSDRGVAGNGHFAMFERNRREVFEVVRGWIEQQVPPVPA